MPVQRSTVAGSNFTHHPVLNDNLPLGIGANFHDDPICRVSLRRSHTTQQEFQVENAFSPHTSYQYAGAGNFSSMVTTTAATFGGSGNLRTGSSRNTSTVPTPSNKPILRFSGFIRERIDESPDEQVRIHRVALIYHMEDKTLLVREAQSANSGLQSGVIVGRQQVMKQDGTPILHSDLKIGSAVSIFGRVLNILDSDESTRRYYIDVLQDSSFPEVGLPWPQEEDTYAQKIQKQFTFRPKKSITTADMDHRRVAEFTTGGSITKHAPEEVRQAKQFFSTTINEHLQFMALWDDREKISGDLRDVLVRYFTENDTIEILEKRAENCGREGGNKILCRQRLPLPGLEASVSGTKTTKRGVVSNGTNYQQGTYGVVLTSNYLTQKDFHIGDELVVHQRKFLIYDADEFTRNWYQLHASEADGILPLGPALDVSEIVNKNQKPEFVHYPPPHNGFGSENDSLRNWKNLILKPTLTKANPHNVAEVVFIVSATLDPRHPSTTVEDASREFVIKYFTNDSSIEIIETQVRNSGIVGGKFLAKGKHVKIRSGDGVQVPFELADFATVGNCVEVCSHGFVITSIDEASRKFLNGEKASLTEDRVKELIVMFRDIVQAKYINASEAYRQIAPDGVLNADEIVRLFDRSAAVITEEEASHLIYFFNENFSASQRDGASISIDTFTKAVFYNGGSSINEAINSKRSIKNVTLLPSEQLSGSQRGASYSTSTRQIRKQFVDKFLQRRANLQEVFRLMTRGGTGTGKLLPAQFYESLVEVFHFQFKSPRDQYDAVRILFDGLVPILSDDVDGESSAAVRRFVDGLSYSLDFKSFQVKVEAMMEQK